MVCVYMYVCAFKCFPSGHSLYTSDVELNINISIDMYNMPELVGCYVSGSDDRLFAFVGDAWCTVVDMLLRTIGFV